VKHPEWQLTPQELEEDEALKQAVIDVHEAIYRDYFLDELLVNHQLPIEVRALRRAEGWRLLLLLTPWMLVRLYLPDTAPEIPIPDNWSGEQRRNAPHIVIGPGVTFELLGTQQKAHLNYHPRLGHYLMLPLIQSMENFASPDEVYSAWNEVIKTRDENVKKLKRHCDWQEEVSRREFFRGLRRT
jgi:hypothetical protein